MIEVGVLLGLMCQHACESSSFNIFHENGLEHIPLSKDNILERTQRILKLAATASGKALNDDASTAVSVPQREEAKFPEELLWDLIKKNQKVLEDLPLNFADLFFPFNGSLGFKLFQPGNTRN